MGRELRKLLEHCLVLFLIVVAELAHGQSQDPPLKNWHWRSPLPQGNFIYNVVFVNDTYVALGELGTLLSSSDGTNWVRRDTGVSDTLRDCAYGAGRYTVVGDFGAALTSTDLVSWTPQYAGTFYHLHGITYGVGQFVAVGAETTIVTSPDGVVWTPRAAGEWELYDVIYANGIFVAGGGSIGSVYAPNLGVILTSQDGRLWTRSQFSPGDPVSSIAYGGGRFAAMEGGNGTWGNVIWTSIDGFEWQPIVNQQYVRSGGISYGAGKWVITSGDTYEDYYAYGPGEIRVSNDLVNWSLSWSNEVAINGVAFGKGQFIAACKDGTLLCSTAGTDWQFVGTPPCPFVFQDLSWLNGAFVGIGDNHLAFSVDGVAWTNIVTVTNLDDTNLLGITYGNGHYVAGGEYRTVWSSTDGVNWTNPAPDITRYPYWSDVAVAYGNGVFVGVSGYEGDVCTSSDGVSWMTQLLASNITGSVYFKDVVFGNGRFVAVSDHLVAVSTDGTNWTANPISLYLNAVASGRGVFVAVGSGRVAVSTNGLDWQVQISAAFGVLMDVAFGGGFFVAVGGNEPAPGVRFESPIWVSIDGLHWSKRRSMTARPLTQVAFGNGTFVIGGSVILQSEPIVNLELTMEPAPHLRLWGPANRSYRIEFKDSLTTPGSWSILTTLTADQMPASINDTNGPGRYYRAVLLP